MAKFEAFMAERGKRMTRERAFVVEVVFKMASPFDAASVLAAVGRTKVQLNVSRSTLYRTLTLLKDSGLIRCETGAGGWERYYHTFNVVPPSPCDSIHKKMIAGTCPWCGGAIIEGEVRET